MFVKKIKITNFKSIYNTQEFDFEDLSGLIKLQGNVGSGKTTLGEAIHFGLFGNVKNINNADLVAWGERTATVEMEVVSNNKNIYIYREIKNNSSAATLKVEIDGEPLLFSNKRTAQQTLEEEYYDISQLAIEQLCLISFENFKPIPQMTPKETRDFLDSIFGLYFLTDYSNIAKNYVKTTHADLIRLETKKNTSVELLNKLSEEQKAVKPILFIDENRSLFKLNNSNEITVDVIDDCIYKINETLIKQKIKRDSLIKEEREQVRIWESDIHEARLNLNREEQNYKKFSKGICPTCGGPIDTSKFINNYEAAKTAYGEAERIYEERRLKIAAIIAKRDKINKTIDTYTDYLYKLKTDKKLLTENKNNYDDLIRELTEKIEKYKKNIDTITKDETEWSELDNLLNKKIRYELFNRLIPSINMNTQHFINQLKLPYNIKFKSDFSCEITPVGLSNQVIKMSSLSTGQKKNFSTAIIFGILKTIIQGINFNIYFLDELFSNMDIDTRDIMLSMLKENINKGNTMFIVNHAEMSDNFFDHVIKVKLNNGDSTSLNDKIIKKYSTYKKVF